MADIKLKPLKAEFKEGGERLTFEGEATDYTLLNFWQWGASDILCNTMRGQFAEFIVGAAMGLNVKNIRDAWGAYDLKTETGIKIEVKSASYIQTWAQPNYSSINFSIKPAKFWNPETGKFDKESKRHADIYVFCLLNHKDQDTIDPLKLEQWTFFVLPTFKLDNYKRSSSSITLKSLTQLAEAVAFADLKKKILCAYDEQMKYAANLDRPF